MATYVNDLRLKEIATGDESGTWGTSTNTNLELIAEAFSFGTEAITTNADTHTTTIADGSTDPGRSLFLKYTGTLDSTCTITLGPNTVSKLWFIENATSGSQSIIISQGSGASITILNGQTKAIYSDGAGSGAAMVDAFTDLSVPSLFLPDNGKAIFGGGSDLQIYHDGSGSFIEDVGTGFLKITSNGDGILLQKSSTETMAQFLTDGAVTLYHDNSLVLSTTSSGIDLTGTVVSDGLTVSPSGTQQVLATLRANSGAGGGLVVQTDASDDGLIRGYDSSGNIQLQFDTDGGDNYIAQGNVGIGTTSPFFTTSGRTSLSVNGSTSSILAFGKGGSSENYILADAGGLTIANTSTTLPTIFFNNGSERLRIDSSGNLLVGTTNTDPAGTSNNVVGTAIGSSGFLSMTRDGNTVAFFNRKSTDGDVVHFRKDGSVVGSIGARGGDVYLETGDTGIRIYDQSDAIIPAGSTGISRDAAIDLGLSNVRFKDLYLSGTIALTTADNASAANMFVSPSTDFLYLEHPSNGMIFRNTSGSERMRIDSSGNVGIGVSSLVTGSSRRILQVSTGSDGGQIAFADSTTEAANPRIFATNKSDLKLASANSGASTIQFITGTTTPAERMRIDSSGLLKIGTSGTVTPYSLSKFAIDTGTYAYMDLLSTGSSGINFGDAGGAQRGTIEYDHGSDFMRFGSAGAERMRIDSSGKLLLATSNTGGTFSVERNGNTYNISAVSDANNTSEGYFRGYSTGAGADRVIIYSNGNIVNAGNSYGALSDLKLKENIVDSGSQWDDVKSVRVRKYSMKLDQVAEANQLGVIAQELESSGMTNLVYESIDRDIDGNDLGTTTKQVKYSILYMKAVKALQEAMDRIETLEAKVQQLENN